MLIDRTIKYRQFVSLALQVLIILAAATCAFWARLEGEISSHWRDLFLFSLIALAVKIPLNRIFQLNHGWWRYTSVGDVKRIVVASFVSMLMIYSIETFVLTYYSRAILILDFVFTVTLKSGIRLGVRMLRERSSMPESFRRRSDKRVLVIGAGDAGISLVKTLQMNSSLDIHLIGFIDDASSKKGMRFADLPVLGGIAEIPQLVRQHSATEAYIAIPSLKKEKLDAIVNFCLLAQIPFKTIPSLKEMLEGGQRIDALREVQVEDLLGRETITLNKTKTAQEILGRSIMVTGAGGSIGSELCRQILEFHPSQLVLFERSEENLFYIERELRDKFPESQIIPVIGDILDGVKVEATIQKYAPKILYHAAAYKHVTMMQRNPREAVRNNVFGTETLLEISLNSKIVQKFVNISTDKAVNPKSIMGYSKRLAEMVCQAKAQDGLEVMSVRFGNVLGSSGSVVEIFRDQIAKGKALTVTDKEATRFFMTAHEAVELVLHASSHGRSGHIYMLDMGRPVKVYQLAQRMIELADPQGRRDLKVVFTGLKDGEKLAEELAWETDDVLPTAVEKVFVLKSALTAAISRAALLQLRESSENATGEPEQLLKELVDKIDGDLKQNHHGQALKAKKMPSLQSESIAVAG